MLSYWNDERRLGLTKRVRESLTAAMANATSVRQEGESEEVGGGGYRTTWCTATSSNSRAIDDTAVLTGHDPEIIRLSPRFTRGREVTAFMTGVDEDGGPLAARRVELAIQTEYSASPNKHASKNNYRFAALDIIIVKLSLCGYSGPGM